MHNSAFLYSYVLPLFFSEIIEGVKRASPGPVALVGGAGGGVSSPPAAAQSPGAITQPLRPTVDEDAADEEIIRMMTRCWSEDPLDRPDFQALKVAIRKLNK